LKPLLYTTPSWEYSEGFDIEVEGEFGIIQRKPEANQEQH